MDGPMAWWYYFGGGIAGVTSVILTWWCCLDAFRHKGSINRFTWPLVAFTGMVLQIPAFTVTTEAQRASSVGTAAAIAAVAGFTLVGMSCVAYFSKSSGSGATWFTRTKDNDSMLSGSRERRTGGSSARPSVSVGGSQRSPRTPTPVDFSGSSEPRATPAPHTAPTAKPSVAHAPVIAPAIPAPMRDVTETDGPDSVKTVVADDTIPDSSVSVTQTGETVIDDATGAVDARTVVAEDVDASAEPTIAEDAGAASELTVTADADAASERTIAEEPDAQSELTVAVDADPQFGPTIAEDADSGSALTVAEEPESDSTIAAEAESPAADGSSELTVTDEADNVSGIPISAHSGAETLVSDDETEVTLTEDPTFATVIDEPDGSGGRLVITDGRSSRIMITERTGPFIVGRDPARAGLAVDDPKVSRAHFSISRVDDDYVISDLESANGTFVNGELLRQGRLLEDGDTVEFGRTIAKFVVDGGPRR